MVNKLYVYKYFGAFFCNCIGKNQVNIRDEVINYENIKSPENIAHEILKYYQLVKEMKPAIIKKIKETLGNIKPY